MLPVPEYVPMSIMPDRLVNKNAAYDLLLLFILLLDPMVNEVSETELKVFAVVDTAALSSISNLEFTETVSSEQFQGSTFVSHNPY